MKMEEPWRYAAHLVGGWCELLEKACVEGLCHSGCHWLKIGCICEACGRSMARMEAQRAWLKAEEECRAFERREIASGGVERWCVMEMQRRRNRRHLVL